MLRSIISALFLMLAFKGSAQERNRDTVRLSDPYGLRVGIDLSRPVISFFNDRYTGLEIAADYRLTARLHLAGEVGNENKSQSEILGEGGDTPEDLIYDYTTKGSYIKLGVDINTYENWYGMYNSIHVGGRYAFSTLTQTVNSISYYDSNRYWSPEGFSPGSLEETEFSGLNASWLEIVVGTKAELIANFYLGASVRLGYLVSNKEADTFPNLWIPGFNRVTDGSRFGVGFNYSISYFLPLYRKAKKPAVPPANTNPQ